jgi:C-3',4' desaturase CrtD
VAVLGAGVAGMATALRLQARGLRTVVFEAHGHAGGCAGYFRKRGFSFDVGATTLVDFAPGGVGAELLDAIGLSDVDIDELPGYRAWLPDRTVTLYRDQAAWRSERLRRLGDTPAHHAFWALIDRLAAAFWSATRAGIRMPVRSPADAWANLRAMRPADLPLTVHLRHTLGDALRRHGLRDDAPLVALLGMLVEDTVHAGVDEAPLINAALGVTMRGAGLGRHRGGMHGLWRRLVAHYRGLGGEILLACEVGRVDGRAGRFRVFTNRGMVEADQVVSALPAQNTAEIADATGVSRRLRPYLDRDRESLGGAVVVFLGVAEEQVAAQELTHHQLLGDYHRPLGDGNNMFVSVSAPGDLDSAPAGHRAVMISTHTELSTWEELGDEQYRQRKAALGADLVRRARLVYPDLAAPAVIEQVGTPRTYASFASRPRGAVGGVRQNLGNANQHALPHDVGVPGFWLVGDSTWPGLGTVACVVGSRLVADAVTAHHVRHPRPMVPAVQAAGR